MIGTQPWVKPTVSNNTISNRVAVAGIQPWVTTRGLAGIHPWVTTREKALKGPNPSNRGSSLRDPREATLLYGPKRAELQKHDNHLFYDDYHAYFTINKKPPMNGIFTPNIGGFAELKA